MTTYVNVYGVKANPYLPSQAVARAMNYVHARKNITPGTCDHMVGIYYGWAHSGEYSAAAHWDNIPAKYRHANTNAPVGALVFWKTRGGGFGHVAIVVAPGQIASTDIKVNGKVDVVSLGTISRYWGNLIYVGWAAPYFGAGNGAFRALQPGKAPTAPSGSPSTLPRVDLSNVQHAAIKAGSDVGIKYIQKALKAAVAYNGAINSTWDAPTRAAYARWQRKLGYVGADADGIPGLKSMQVLGGRYKFYVAA